MSQPDSPESPATISAPGDPSGETIKLIYVDEPIEGEKGFFGGTRQAVMRVADVDPTVVTTNLTNFCKRMVGLIEGTDTPHGQSQRFALECFEVTVELAAGGEVRMIGSVNTEIRGGLKLVFSRRKAE